MQSNKFTQAKAEINTLIKLSYKILSCHENLFLIELLEDQQRFIVDLDHKTIHNTRTLDSGIDFDGTGHTKDEETVVQLKVQKYSKDLLHDRIMSILNLPSRSGWSIVDSVGKLYLIHYTDTADMTLVGHIRGILVDVEEGRIIASSYGHTPSAKLNQLSFTDNKMTIVDDDQQEHEFEESRTVIKPIYEGVIMRVIYYEGQCYRLTHKKIRPLKSRWGNLPFFTQMYKAAGGPQDHELFDLTKTSSPYCYVFLVVHPKLLMASREQIKDPYVVLLTVKKLWSSEDESVEQEKFFTNEQYTPKSFTLNQANQHLAFGYYPPSTEVKDIRQTAGESVIIYKLDEHDNVVDIVKVNSSAYDYRFKLRGSDPNPYHRFYDLVSHSYNTIFDYVSYTEYKQKFVLFDNYTENDLNAAYNHYGFLLYLGEADIPMHERKNRQYILKNIWLNYVLFLPFSLQKEAITYLDRFQKDRNSVVTWLQAYNTEHHFVDSNDITERGKNIIMSARYTAKDLCIQQPHKNYHQTVNDVIRNFVYKEYGSSLYALVKNMKK